MQDFGDVNKFVALFKCQFDNSRGGIATINIRTFNIIFFSYLVFCSSFFCVLPTYLAESGPSSD